MYLGNGEYKGEDCLVSEKLFDVGKTWRVVSGWVPELDMINDDMEIIEKCIFEQINAAVRDGAFCFSTSMLDSNVNPKTVDFFCEKVKQYGG